MKKFDFDYLFDIPTQEKVLDYWCKLTNRDICIFYPKKEKDIIKYLNKEIIKTIKLYCEQNNKMEHFNKLDIDKEYLT
tara:strand:+ start:435 stop:668 length:234 start_codon:yes stop_codon:yes gene_type:complete